MLDLTEEVDAETSNEYKEFQNKYHRRVFGLSAVIPTVTMTGDINMVRVGSIWSILTNLAGGAMNEGTVAPFPAR
ncbi:MAG: hypothetical protein WBA91_06760 [Paracoccaceae bacterium]